MNLDTLYAAAIAGDADARAKLEIQADKLDEYECTILHTEAKNGNAERVRFILREFAHKNLLTKITIWKHTALHLAVYRGHTEVAEILIHAARDLPSSSAKDINTRDNPVTPFQAFLRQGDKDMDTALHEAVMDGHVAIVKLLVAADPTDRHIQNHEGKTPMYIAVEKGYNDIVEIISTICTAPSLDGPYGDTVVRIDNLDQVKSPGGTLYKIKDRYAFYDAAINAGDADAIAKLEMEADKLGYFNETILHVESALGKTECVRFLLKAFAHKNLLVKLSRSKQTALHLATEEGHTDVAEVLIDAARHLPNVTHDNPVTSFQAFLMQGDNNGDTALHLAAYNGHTEVAKVLIDAAARHLPNDDTHDNPVTSFQAFLRQGDEDMDTALHAAAENGHVDIVKLLVEADQDDRHIKNNRGRTPIYIAAEKGYFNIVELICTTCTAPSLDGPERSTALHAAISNIDKVEEGNRDVIRLLIVKAKYQRTEGFFDGVDKDGLSLLNLAVGKNDLDVVKLLLESDPSYVRGKKKNSLMRSIYISDDKKNSDMVELLSKTYEVGKIGIHEGKKNGLVFSKFKETVDGGKVGAHKGVVSLILAIRKRQEGVIRRYLEEAPNLVTFAEDEGWTPLHYVAYHNYDLILDVFIAAQRNVEHPFTYGDMVSTPFHVAAEKGYISTVIQLMQLWPQSPPAYTAVNNIGQNILHIAAAKKNKEMIQGILKQCPDQAYQKTMFEQQDADGNTFLHLLFLHGCFIPELIKHGKTKNNKGLTPRDMLYISEDVINDQAKIKFALDDEAQTNQSRIFCWRSPKKEMDILESQVEPEKRKAKDVKFNKKKQSWKDEKHIQMKKEKEKNLDKYKQRTNTQIIVCALITTVTFTVGFTMPGGLRQSEQVGEGLVVLSRKAAFRAFMVSDAIALLLSTSSMFFYFLGSMGEDHWQVTKLPLGAASTVFNIVSIMAMMLTFIAGTYVVLSHSPALAITVCVIGSLFFLLLIVILIKIMCDRPKWYEVSEHMPAGQANMIEERNMVPDSKDVDLRDKGKANAEGF